LFFREANFIVVNFKKI